MNQDNYSLLLKQCAALIDGEPDLIANAANISALLFNSLENVNWVGFYFLKGNELVLGPFGGQPACTRIPLGKGVCGTAFSKMQTLVIEDVHAFPGHIACDVASESELVVPFEAGEIAGVLDVDSPKIARFGEAEKVFFEQLVKVICANIMS